MLRRGARNPANIVRVLLTDALFESADLQGMIHEKKS